MSITVRSSAYLNQRTFEDATFENSGEERPLIDLRTCQFADIYALVALLTITTLADEQGVAVQILLPSDSNVANYLARMRFFELLPDGVQLDRAPPRVREHESALVPLTRIDARRGGEHAVEELCNFAHDRLTGWVAEAFTDALAEIGINVVYHSESDVGFVAAQRYPGTSTLHFVVGDAGIGIRESLARGRPEAQAMDDADAILLALEEGVTGKPGVHSGVGLPTVYRLSSDMSIRSGNGLVTKRWRGPHWRLVPGLSGTIVSATIRE